MNDEDDRKDSLPRGEFQSVTGSKGVKGKAHGEVKQIRQSRRAAPIDIFGY